VEAAFVIVNTITSRYLYPNLSAKHPVYSAKWYKRIVYAAG